MEPQQTLQAYKIFTEELQMKKILALLLAVIMVLSLVACATTEKPAEDNKQN